MSGIVIGLFFAFGLLGMPLAFALGLAATGGLYYGDMGLDVMPQRMMHAIDSFPLMAIPLFMLAGELMVAGDIMSRLVTFANSIVGRVHGGLAHVTIITGAILAAVSGAAVASASALGSSLIPVLRKQYDDGYSSAIIASSANLGPIIPPSGAMIVYALMAGSSVSVGGMFMAGVVPGLILMAGFMVLASWIAKRRDYPLTGEPFELRRVLHETRRAFVIFMMPIIVVGGIVGGVFTPTEGAAIATVYSLIIGFFITKKLKISDLPEVFFRAAVTSSMVGALIAFAAASTFIFTIDLLPLTLANWVKSVTTDPNMFLAMMMILLVIVGMFIESISAYIMLVPIFAPIAMAYHIDPLFFGFIFVFNLVIGMMTPPVGVLLFVMSGITGLPIARMIKEVLPFVLLQYGVLVLCILFPALPLWLPRLLGY